MDSTKKWNEILRYQRELRGWSQQRVAKALGTEEKRVSEWERGKSKPGPHYRAKILKLFEKNADEFGFLEQALSPTEEGTPSPDITQESHMPEQEAENSDRNGQRDIQILIPQSVALS